MRLLLQTHSVPLQDDWKAIFPRAAAVQTFKCCTREVQHGAQPCRRIKVALLAVNQVFSLSEPRGWWLVGPVSGWKGDPHALGAYELVDHKLHKCWLKQRLPCAWRLRIAQEPHKCCASQSPCCLQEPDIANGSQPQSHLQLLHFKLHHLPVARP